MIKNLRIGARLGVGIGLVLALLCLTVAVAAWQRGRLAENSNPYAVNLVPSYETEHRVALAPSGVRLMKFRHPAAIAPLDIGKAESQIADYRKVVSEGLHLYAKDLISDDQDKRLMDSAKAAMLAYYAEWGKLRPLSRLTATDPSKTEEANAMILGHSAKTYEAAQSAGERCQEKSQS